MRLSRSDPALPVRDARAAADFYEQRLGFRPLHVSDDFVRLLRDAVEIDLWVADDADWALRPDLAEGPVCTGAETFLAGTASARIEVDDAAALHGELAAADVLHPHAGSVTDTEWGTREFAVLDLDGNLLTFYELRAG